MAGYDPKNDAYSLLGVHPESAPGEIEEAYRAAVLRWHPDKSPAPDAADWFIRVREAGEILRDAAKRREYDRRRALHHGVRARTPRFRVRTPQPYVPVAPAPSWLRVNHSVIRDAVLFHLPRRERSYVRELGFFLAVAALGGALVTGWIQFALLALVGYAIVAVQAQPPSPQPVRWAKIAPGRRSAECATLDAVAGHMIRYDVPYARLAVAVVGERSNFRVELQGFPVGTVTLHPPTRDVQTAQRCAREVGRWLDLPVRAAA